MEALPSNRSVRAVQQQIIRLGLKRGPIVPTKEKNIVPTIETGEVMTRKEALKILASAIKHLQAGGNVEDIEIRRLRAVAMLVRNYFMIFDSYEKYTELKERVKKLEDVSNQEDKEHLLLKREIVGDISSSSGVQILLSAPKMNKKMICVKLF